MGGDDLAGEYKTSGVDFGGAGGVDGAKIVRRNQQPVGAAGQKRDSATELPLARASTDRAARPSQQGRDASSMSDRHVRLCPHITSLASAQGSAAGRDRFPQIGASPP